MKFDIFTKSYGVFSGMAQKCFETKNGFIRCPLTRMRSLVPKFAFLVPQYEHFLEIWLLHKIMRLISDVCVEMWWVGDGGVGVVMVF